MKPINFYSENKFSLSLDFCANDWCMGNFIIEGRNGQIHTPFTGIGLELLDSLYTLSFIVNWRYTTAPHIKNYTAFSGEITKEANDLHFLDLNWLSVSEDIRTSNILHKEKGKSMLYEFLSGCRETIKNLSMPFPHHHEVPITTR